MAFDDHAGVSAAIERAEQYEQDAEELYENAPAGYFSTRIDGTLVKVNATFLAWTGYDRESLVGTRRIHDLLAPGSRIYYETHYAPLLQMQGAVGEIAVELLHADGRRLPMLMNSVLVAGSPGHSALIRSTVFDATERRRYERELLAARADAESRARASLALDHVSDGVMLLDGADRVLLLNPAAAGILGVSADDVTGVPIREIVPEWESLVNRIATSAVTGRVSSTTAPLDRGGYEQWLSFEAADTGDGVVYTIRDISTEQRLEQLRSDLVAVVSHELRTPLTGMHGAAQTLLAREGELTPEQRRALLEIVSEQGVRLTRIVEQILLTSRLDTSNVVVETTPFDVTIEVGAVIRGLGQPSERIEFEHEDALLARGDATMFGQVAANLIDNALKYSEAGVRIALERRDSLVRLTVADDGPGIPLAERDRVFQKFYRLDPAQSRGVAGTGLGLYIARELVDRMNGRIGLAPSAAGTTIFVELPVAD